MGSAGVISHEKLASAAAFDPSQGKLANALIVYVLNVGDGDAIVVQFPKLNGTRAYAVLDAFDGAKTLGLLADLGAATLRFLCATHPHLDHIKGIPDVLDHFGAAGAGTVNEFWDSGFRFTSVTYRRIIEMVAGDPGMRFVRPTSGYETRIGGATVTVLSPSIHLRNRYDTHGVDVNNASIVVRIDYPARSFVDDVIGHVGDPQAGEPKTRSIILGGDAQTDAWSKVLEEFPHFHKDPENFGQQIQARTRRQPLVCDAFKVSHHASKHGINLELIERMGDVSGTGQPRGPRFLISSCADGSQSGYGFPHGVVQEIMREVRFPTASSGKPRPGDDDLGIHFTSQRIDDPQQAGPAGSVAVVLYDDGSPPDLYRFGDDQDQPVDLTNARKAL
jgi:beta-lactamase superfamily II metal-dependent hydrolase